MVANTEHICKIILVTYRAIARQRRQPVPRRPDLAALEGHRIDDGRDRLNRSRLAQSHELIRERSPSSTRSTNICAPLLAQEEMDSAIPMNRGWERGGILIRGRLKHLPSGHYYDSFMPAPLE